MPDDNKLLFRFHRGSLDDSMKTVIEIQSLDHLIQLIAGQFDLQICEIIIEPYCYDNRIDWDTHMVQIRVPRVPTHKIVESIIYPLGFLNRLPDWEISND